MSNPISSGIQDGIAAGLGMGVVAFITGIFTGARRAHRKSLELREEIKRMDARITVLEGASLRDKTFKQTLVGSQIDQMAILKAVIAIQSRRCDGCPVEVDATADRLVDSTQRAIDESSRRLTDYLGSLA